MYWNACRFQCCKINQREPLIIPTSLAIGDAIHHVREQMVEKKELGQKYTFSGSVYFERMKLLGMYSTDRTLISKNVKTAEMLGVFETAF